MLKLAGEKANSALVPTGRPIVPVSVALPVFETVKVCAALVVLTVTFPKEREVGATAIFGACMTPAPVTGRLVGLVEALLANTIVPESVPALVGV